MTNWYVITGGPSSGKTTTVRILTTLLRPDAGRATVLGHDVVAEPAAVRRRIGLTGQYAAVDDALSAVVDGELLVVVGHGGAIRSGTGALLGLDVDHWGRLGRLSNCSWSVLDETARGWRLVEHNINPNP